jgi:hypothetical protein
VKLSSSGATLAGGDFCLTLVCGDEVPRLARHFGVREDSIQVAQAILPTGGPLFGIVAVRVPGHSGQELLEARLDPQSARSSLAISVLGRDVVWAFYCSGTTFNCADYLYPRDDVLFMVKYAGQAGPSGSRVPDDVQTAFEALP